MAFAKAGANIVIASLPPESIPPVVQNVEALGVMGLGLAVCRTIVNAHSGRLWAVNNPEGGATVTVELPAIGAAREVAQPL